LFGQSCREQRKGAMMYKKAQPKPKQAARHVEEAKPKQAPRRTVERTPDAVVHEEAPHIEAWRCVWCGNVETIEAHVCSKCRQNR
jgi:hypothetical protein